VEAVDGGGGAEGGDVLGGVGVGEGQAVGDGCEAEVRQAVEGAGAAGAEEATVVELGVDEGDVETSGMQKLGQLQHWVDVPLRGERNTHCVSLHFTSF